MSPPDCSEKCGMKFNCEISLANPLSKLSTKLFFRHLVEMLLWAVWWKVAQFLIWNGCLTAELSITTPHLWHFLSKNISFMRVTMAIKNGTYYLLNSRYFEFLRNFHLTDLFQVQFDHHQCWVWQPGGLSLRCGKHWRRAWKEGHSNLWRPGQLFPDARIDAGPVDHCHRGRHGRHGLHRHCRGIDLLLLFLQKGQKGQNQWSEQDQNCHFSLRRTRSESSKTFASYEQYNALRNDGLARRKSRGGRRKSSPRGLPPSVCWWRHWNDGTSYP